MEEVITGVSDTISSLVSHSPADVHLRPWETFILDWKLFSSEECCFRLLSAVWRVSRARGGGIVVMQDNTDTRDSHHLLRAISVCPTQPDTSLSSVVSEFVILTTSSQLSHSRERKYWGYWKIFYMSILLISRG